MKLKEPSSHSASAAPGRSKQPMYLTLARTLMTDIQLGRYGVGAQLPTEADLQKRFSVSRHTVREAMRELQQQGVVSTLQGIGTIVRAQASSLHFTQRASSFEDLVEFSKATRMRVLRQREFVAEAAHIGVLQCQVGQAWLEVEVLRMGPDNAIPIGFLSTYLRPEFADVVQAIGSSRRPIFALVEQMHGVQTGEMEQEIASVPLPLRIATELGAPPDSHGLQITRRYREVQGRLTQVSVGLYPEGRLVHSSKIRIERSSPHRD